MQDTINATIRYNGAVLALNNIVNGSVATNEHGFAEASITAMLPRNTRTNSIYQAMSGQAAELVVCCGPDTLYEGRVEMVEIGGNTADFSAVGYQQACRDLPYTAMWSDTRTDVWRPLLTTEQAAAAPGRYTFNTNNQLWIAPNKGAVHAGAAGTSRIGYLVYLAPDDADRALAAVSFTYNVVAPGASWVFGVQWYDASFTVISSSNIAAGSASGATTVTLTGSPVAVAFYFYDSGAGAALAAETGVNYARVTDVHVKSTTSTSIYADEIVKDIVSYMAGETATQVNDNTAYIDNPSLALNDQIYEDMLPADIFSKLCLLGDSNVPPNRYEWQVWENKLLFFRRKGLYNNTWHVVGDDIRIANNNGDIVNSTYATYRDASGRTLRTTVDTEIDASLFQAVLRRQAVQANTTSALQAEVNADAVRYDKRRAQARLQFQLNTAHNITTGYRVPAWRIRSGDTVIVRNIPAATSGLNGVNTFTVLRTEFDIVKRTMTITPDNPAPVLEMMLARRDMSRL